MQKITAQLKKLQIGPRKVRLVADLIRGRKVQDAKNILKVLNKASAKPMLKLLESAIANAKHNHEMEAETLRVQAITVNEGPVMRRFMPRAHGSASPILKRSCHIYLELGAINNFKKDGKKVEAKIEKEEKKEAKKAVKAAPKKPAVKKAKK